MTTPRRDDEMLPRDRRFDAAWRSASHDEPRPALDAAILAAARREVATGPQPAGMRHAKRARKDWWALAAAATIGAIAVGVLQLVPPDDIGAPAPEQARVSDMPAPDAAPAPQVAKPVPQVALSQPEIAKPAPQVANSRSVPAPVAAPPAQRKEEQASSVAVTLPEPFPAAPPPRAAAMGDARALGKLAAAPATASPPAIASQPEAAAEARGIPASEPLRPSPAAKVAAGRADEAATTPMRAPESRENDRPPLPVADWIALIRRLREQGKPNEAARELAAFRAAHADHERLLPPELRDWRPPPK